MGHMIILPFHEAESGTWSYVLADRASGEAAIIDPVWLFDPVSGEADTGFTDRILAVAEERGLSINWVLETHAHADHLTSAAHIRERTGAKVAIGRGIQSVQENFAKVFNLCTVPTDGSQFDRLLDEGDVISLGALEVRVMETPGHTSDSLTYLAGDAAFIGDTLFAPSFGTARCDFPGGDAGMLFDSISRIHDLPPQTRLHLCHDYPSSGSEPVSVVTVAESRANNIHVSAGTSRQAFVRMRTERDAQLKLPRLIYPSLQVNIRAGEAPDAENNGARYLRLPFNAELAALLQGAGKSQ
jgi:glyoxylase-like metal-dependent hydrolase (beta-lactamase superfamily II)